MRKMIFAFCFFALLFSVAQLKAEKKIKFLIFSDIHAEDVPDGEQRLQEIVTAATKEKVDFVIQLGDFLRFDEQSIPLWPIWNSLSADKFYVLGNHDMDKYTKDTFVQKLGMPSRYYSFDKGNFHFIVLDGNNLFDGKQYIPYGNANFYVDASKRAFLDPLQLAWLKKDIESTDKYCILFSHQSIDHAMSNQTEVRKILEAENARCGYTKVAVAFSGHDHSNYTKVIDGITYEQINSVSYVWIGKPTETEKRFSATVNSRYGLMKYSIPYTRTLYGIVELTDTGLKMKGREGKFIPPTPKEMNMSDSINGLPLVSDIKSFSVKFNHK